MSTTTVTTPIVKWPQDAGDKAAYLLFDGISFYSTYHMMCERGWIDCMQALCCVVCGVFAGLREDGREGAGSNFIHAITYQPEALIRKPSLAVWQPILIFGNMAFVRYFGSFDIQPLCSGLAVRTGIVVVRIIRGEVWGKQGWGVRVR